MVVERVVVEVLAARKLWTTGSPATTGGQARFHDNLEGN